MVQTNPEHAIIFIRVSFSFFFFLSQNIYFRVRYTKLSPQAKEEQAPGKKKESYDPTVYSTCPPCFFPRLPSNTHTNKTSIVDSFKHSPPTPSRHRPIFLLPLNKSSLFLGMNAASGEFPASEGSDSWLADDTPRLDDYLRGQVGALLWL